MNAKTEIRFWQCDCELLDLRRIFDQSVEVLTIGAVGAGNVIRVFYQSETVDKCE